MGFTKERVTEPPWCAIIFAELTGWGGTKHGCYYLVTVIICEKGLWERRRRDC